MCIWCCPAKQEMKLKQATFYLFDLFIYPSSQVQTELSAKVAKDSGFLLINVHKNIFTFVINILEILNPTKLNNEAMTLCWKKKTKKEKSKLSNQSTMCHITFRFDC